MRCSDVGHRLLRRLALGLGLGLSTVTISLCCLPVGRAQLADAEKLEEPVALMREGTRILDRQAVCRASGERLLITLDETGTPLIALENLAAQRILKAVLDDAADERWIVDGLVTEFQDHNYLLLERVVRQPKAK